MSLQKQSFIQKTFHMPRAETQNLTSYTAAQHVVQRRAYINFLHWGEIYHLNIFSQSKYKEMIRNIK